MDDNAASDLASSASTVSPVMEHAPPEDNHQPKEDLRSQDAKQNTHTLAEDRPTAPNMNSFNDFRGTILALDNNLLELSNAARKLGSSVGILAAATRLRERLGPVELLFRQNARELFPDFKEKKSDYQLLNRQLNRGKHNHRHGDILDQMTYPHTVDTDIKHLVAEFKLFVDDLCTLLHCFCQYPEFVDEVPEAKLMSDLKGLAETLNEDGDDFSNVAIQRFLYDSMAEVGGHLEVINEKFIPPFTKIGIPTINASQKHSVSGFDDLSTVATFFSGVTATMFQFSYSSNGGKLPDSVNVLWFLSFVFSISAAINSLLALTWTQAMFRSPDYLVPSVVRLWMMRSPLIFLVLSVTCFIVGLVLFTFSSDQATLTIILTTVFSAVSCTGIAVMSTWFACESYIYERYGGHLWLADAIRAVRQKAEWLTFATLDSIHSSEVWQYGLRTAATQGPDPEAAAEQDLYGLADDPFWPSPHYQHSLTPKEAAVYRWREATRRVIIGRRRSGDSESPPAYSEKPESHAAWLNSTLTKQRTDAFKSNIETLRVIHTLNGESGHESLVHLMRFSPDGEQLATGSLDNTCRIFEVKNMSVQHKLKHPPGPKIAHQLEWASDGSRLLMRRNHLVTIWSSNGEALFNYTRPHSGHPIHCAVWGRDSFTYLSAGKGEITFTNLKDRDFDDHDVDNWNIRAIAVSRNAKWLVCIGQYQHDTGKSTTSKVKKVNQILLYDLESFEIVTKVPVFYEMSDICLAQNDASVLASCAGKKAPSQLWDLRLRRAGSRIGPEFIFRHTYTMPENSASSKVLPSAFGGPYDRLVLRVAVAGAIYAWDRDSAMLLHCIKIPDLSNETKLTAFAWNRGSSDKWMFATGTSNGAVHIWSHDEVEGVDEKAIHKESGLEDSKSED